MMRAIFWILLLGNVIFFAVMQWGKPLVSDEQSWLAQPALNEDKVRLLAASQSAPAATSPASAAIAPPVAVPAPAAAPEPASAPLALKPDALTCLEWGDFSGADLARSTAALSALQLGDKLSQRQIEHSIGYWVYIPPLKDKAAVNQKIGQLKTRGIEEYFIVQDSGPWLNAISLGIFRTQEAAQVFLNHLRTRGVRSAQVGERANKFNTTLFVLDQLDNATVAKLAEIQKDFHGSELKKISCAQAAE